MTSTAIGTAFALFVANKEDGIMTATLRLTVLTGPHKGNRFCWRGKTAVMLGRAAECPVCFCGDQRDQSISRRHCQVSFEPPLMRVCDLDSANGTYINGRRLTEAESARAGNPGEAGDGDLLTIGGTTVQVNLRDCPLSCQQSSDSTIIWDENELLKKNCPVEC
jgi:pSer/pThr/pTyr-binding forkhead associated (FHA) protein